MSKVELIITGVLIIMVLAAWFFSCEWLLFLALLIWMGKTGYFGIVRR